MDVPNDIEYSETLSIHKMDCEKPIKLEIGCNLWNIANIDIETSFGRTQVSSTADGKIIVIVNNDMIEFGSAFLEGFTFGLVDISNWDFRSEIRSIIAELGLGGIQVQDVHVISSLGDVLGFVLFTDGDALGALGARPSSLENAVVPDDTQPAQATDS